LKLGLISKLWISAFHVTRKLCISIRWDIRNANRSLRRSSVKNVATTQIDGAIISLRSATPFLKHVRALQMPSVRRKLRSVRRFKILKRETSASPVLMEL
jgi:hypothetical protein